jgi:hypothetical protein
MAGQYAPLFQEGNRRSRMAPLRAAAIKTTLELVLLTCLIYYPFPEGDMDRLGGHPCEH